MAESSGLGCKNRLKPGKQRAVVEQTRGLRDNEQTMTLWSVGGMATMEGLKAKDL